jgi:hypothetical protein
VLELDLVYQALQNIVNYHTGKLHLLHVPWARLYSPDFHAT